jgi:hypothetical protein
MNYSFKNEYLIKNLQGKILTNDIAQKKAAEA